MRHIVAALLAVFTPFAASAKDKPAEAPRVAACEPQPHMIVNDKNGRPQTAIFLCYRDDGVVVHTERALTFDEILALITPKPGASQAAQTLRLPEDVAKAPKPHKSAAAAVTRTKARFEPAAKASGTAPVIAAPQAHPPHDQAAAPAKPAA